ncbi:MAG: hypothetical protein Q8J65_00145 [Nitrosomonadales bacterium]|nr:hypothetical protein [Nitrosomonadales bacterium]
MLERLCRFGRSSTLAGLLAKSQREILQTPLDALICHQAGVQLDPELAQVDALPLAAISYLGEDLQAEKPSARDGYFMFADPAHLVLQRDSFALASPVPINLSPEESGRLLDSLNQHFDSDGLKFIQGTSGHWYLQQMHQPQIMTFHPEMAINRDINAFLPQGAEAANWNQLINEIQMLLFSHPVNQERESRGLPACNSLWFWGGGKLPEQYSNKMSAVYASAPLLKGLCRLGDINCQVMPAEFPITGVLDTTWMVFDEAHQLDEAWFEAAIKSLASGRIKTLQLYFAVDGKVLKSSLRRRDLWKFWQKSVAIQSYFEV